MVVLKQVTRRTTRATSEPVEPVRSIDLRGIDTARRISIAARDDSDQMMLASKRHDQQLLSDINAKLANQSFLTSPATVKRSSKTTTYVNPRKPPISPAAAANRPSSITTTSTAVYSTTPASHRRLQQHLSYNNNNNDTSDDSDRMPPTPVTRSVMRAASLPPPTAAAAADTSAVSRPFCPLTYAAMKLGGSQLNGPSTTVTTYTDEFNGGSTGAQNGIDQVGGYVRTRVTGPPARLTPVTDLAIRQAHRDLDRIERELKYHPVAEGTPDRYRYLIPKSFVSVSQVDKLPVRRPLPTNASLTNSMTSSSVTVGGVQPQQQGGVGSLRVRAVSLSPARTLTSTNAGYPRTSHFSSLHRSSSPVRPSELVALATVLPRTTADSKVTSKLTSKLLYEAEQDPHPQSSTLYRAWTQSPYTYTVQPSLSSAPSSPLTRSHAHADFTSTPASTSGRPKMSDARRKVREVLCKVKQDPHYFD